MLWEQMGLLLGLLGVAGVVGGVLEIERGVEGELGGCGGVDVRLVLMGHGIALVIGEVNGLVEILGDGGEVGVAVGWIAKRRDWHCSSHGHGSGSSSDGRAQRLRLYSGPRRRRTNNGCSTYSEWFWTSPFGPRRYQTRVALQFPSKVSNSANVEICRNTQTLVTRSREFFGL